LDDGRIQAVEVEHDDYPIVQPLLRLQHQPPGVLRPLGALAAAGGRRGGCGGCVVRLFVSLVVVGEGGAVGVVGGGGLRLLLQSAVGGPVS